MQHKHTIDSFESQRSKLCHHCHMFFETSAFDKAVAEADSTGTVTITIDKHRDDLNRTVSSCEICTLILGDTHNFDGSVLQIAIEFTLGERPYEILSARLLYQESEIEQHGPATGYNITIASYNVHASPDDAAAQYIAVRPVQTDVASPESFKTALSWLKECSENHSDCTITGDHSMPTRCLNIHDLESIHLCEMKLQKQPYAALSYCWGPKQHPNLVTTKSSLTDATKNIPLSKFPLTLRDGILVTRNLGLDYLWIDALCIIQDDEDDKEIEIPRIRQIFQHAFCTIIAATAAHCHAGFLHRRELIPASTLKVPFPGPKSSRGTMVLSQTDPEKYSLYDPLQDPINERAWTLEERLLSSRRLIYSKYHLRWLCETTELTNGGHVSDRKWPAARAGAQMERLPPGLSPRNIIIAPNQQQQQQQPPNNTPYPRETWLSWLRIVREYNLRALTKPQDKLRALGGIAELYQLRTRDRYCAGLWYSQLAEELLWSVRHPRLTFQSMIDEARHGPGGSSTPYPSRSLLPRPAAYRAPSWSWAAVDGPAANHRALTGVPLIADFFRVVGCDVVPRSVSSALTGVAAAVLTVSGRVRTAVLDVASEVLFESDAAFAGGGESFASAQLDALEDETAAAPSRLVVCLEISSRVRKGFVGNQQGILLVHDVGSNTYSRIGLFGTDDISMAWFEGVAPQEIRIV